MGTDGVYADHSEVAALSKCFNARIIVYGGPASNTVKQVTINEDCEKV